MLKLSPLFSDHMVLQRRKPVLVWGSGSSGSAVSVSIAGNTVSTEVADGKWSVKLSPMEAGGPYELVVRSEGEQKVFRNVLVGEVWLAGGQSNMELELQNSDNGKEVIKETFDERVRFYYTPKISYVGEELLEAEAKNGWMECKPETTAAWSAVGYYFAKKLSKELDVPVGIIGCNWGGTIANNWVSRESLLRHPELAHFVHKYDEIIAAQDFEEYLKELAEYKEYHKNWEIKVNEAYATIPGVTWEGVQEIAGICKWPGPMGPRHEYRPAGLYESMVCRVAPYTLGGALYYQGESDENDHLLYRSLLQNLIEEWRDLWQDKDLPFGIVQLPVYADTGEQTGHGWGVIRKAQQDICRTIKNTSLTVITDCGETHNIHPTDKKTVGTRLAENVLKDIFALTEFQGNGPEATGYECVCVHGKQGINVFFSRAEEGFYVNGEKLEEQELQQDVKAAMQEVQDLAIEVDGFEIAGADGKFMPAKVIIEAETIFLYHEEVSGPCKVRYGSKNYYLPELKDVKDRPVMPFWLG